MGNNQTYKQYTREKTEDRLNIKEEELNIEEKRLAIKRKRLTTKEKELQNKEAGSRYFCESLFWASQPKQAAKT